MTEQNTPKMTHDEMIDTLKGLVFGTFDRTTPEERVALNMAIEALKQEPKTGHWEWVQYDYNPKLGNWHCSECRCVVVECVDKEEKGGIPLYKYCPQCGTKMQEVEI